MVSFAGETTTVTIASGEAESGEIDVRGVAGVAFHMPSEWTSASVGIKAALESGGTFGAVYDESTLYSMDGGASRVIVLDPRIIMSLQFIKLWSQNGSGSDTNQGAKRTIGVSLY